MTAVPGHGTTSVAGIPTLAFCLHRTTPVAEAVTEDVAGDWHGRWSAPCLWFTGGTARPFVQTIAVDSQGVLSGHGTDSDRGERFRIDGRIETDGGATRARWTKSYPDAPEPDQLDYEAIFDGASASGHFVHRRIPQLRGTFSMTRGRPAGTLRSYVHLLGLRLLLAGLVAVLVFVSGRAIGFLPAFWIVMALPTLLWGLFHALGYWMVARSRRRLERTLPRARLVDGRALAATARGRRPP